MLGCQHRAAHNRVPPVPAQDLRQPIVVDELLTSRARRHVRRPQGVGNCRPLAPPDFEIRKQSPLRHLVRRSGMVRHQRNEPLRIAPNSEVPGPVDLVDAGVPKDRRVSEVMPPCGHDEQMLLILAVYRRRQLGRTRRHCPNVRPPVPQRRQQLTGQRLRLIDGWHPLHQATVRLTAANTEAERNPDRTHTVSAMRRAARGCSWDSSCGRWMLSTGDVHRRCPPASTGVAVMTFFTSSSPRPTGARARTTAGRQTAPAPSGLTASGLGCTYGPPATCRWAGLWDGSESSPLATNRLGATERRQLRCAPDPARW